MACKQEEPVVEPKLDVAPATVSVAATAGEATFNVTSNQSWVAISDADWVSLDPANGAASEKAVTVKVTADDNTTAEARKATVTVKAGALTKTVEVTQAAAQGEEPGPGEDPGLQASEWALVGSFGEGNFWNAASELYLSVLDENYFVYYALELASDTEFKFLKGGAWPPTGQEIGGNGLVEPNTIQPAGGSNIKVTEAGTYDVYLAADLTKFYVMSVGKTPAEATEPKPVETSWGMMGMFVDNQWSSDVPMAKEGEWVVAKGAQFSELTFKIRGNQSWADATNIGVAPGSDRGVVNGKVSVVTAEYSKANLGGDAADIKLNGEPGTYDVYFSVENMEVYVMEQGYKPGEKEPQNPDPVEITYTVVGTIADNAWSNNAAVGLMAVEGNYHVVKNVPFVWNSTLYGGEYNRIEFKIVETGTWDGFAYPEKNVDQYANAEITVHIGGENIAVDAPVGNYDVYFDKANLKVWVMEAGYKPGEKEPLLPQPEEPVTEGVIWENDGTAGASSWAAAVYRYSIKGGDAQNECVAEIPAAVWTGMKTTPFIVNVSKAPEAQWWQIRITDGWWSTGDQSGDSDITINTPGLVNYGDGTYAFQVDLTSNPDLAEAIDTKHLLFAGDGFIINKIYFGELEAPAQPEPEYTLDGKQWYYSNQGVLVDLGLYEEGAMVVAVPLIDGSGFGAYMFGAYEVVKTDATSGKIVFTQYDPEWDEWMEPVDYPYSELSENFVMIGAEPLTGDPTPLPFVALDEPFEIQFEEIGGGSPSGEIEDGEYWFIEPTTQKVMTALGETQTYGRPASVDAVGGASTAKNAYTFTYDPDWSCYTIQDSYGRYLYSSMQSDGVTPYRTLSVSDSTPADEESLTYYMWTVYNNGDGTYDVYNCATYYSITYSTSYNNWEIYDPYEDDFSNLFPALVKADNPVAEPEPEEPSTGDFSSNVKFGTVSSAYTDGVATVNEVANVATLKLGTSKLYGEGTVTLPAGTTKVTYYAVAWKGTSATLEFSVGGTVVGTQKIAANVGATGNAPYTMTVTDSDCYTINLPSALEAETVVTVKTVTDGYRAIIFGANAQ